MKKILIIGGTRFVGRNLVKALLESGQYDLTLFNRGQTNAGLFPAVKRIIGDRKTDDIRKIAQQDWDCILDISGYWPIPLDKQLDLLEGKVGRYVYVSTTSHYQMEEIPTKPLTEDHPLVACTEEEKMGETYATYNQRKAESERILQSKTWLNKIILRPGLIIGPHDHSDRLYYWFHKVMTQEAFMIPNHGKNVISYTDVNDFARMIIQSIEVDNNFDVYNATSYEASIGAFISGTMKHYGKTPKLINATPEFLEKHEVSQWRDLPLWLNGDFYVKDSSRVKADYNFVFSTPEETMPRLWDYYENTLEWRAPKPMMPALSVEKERELMGFLLS